MKRFLFFALAATLSTPGIGALPARAQEASAPPSGTEEPRSNGGGGMLAGLGLTADQAVKFKAAMHANDAAVGPLVRRMKGGFKTLADQVEAKASDADVQKTLDALNASRKALADAYDVFLATLASFLSPTQQARFFLTMSAQRPAAQDNGVRGGGRKTPPPHDGDGSPGK